MIVNTIKFCCIYFQCCCDTTCCSVCVVCVPV